MLLSREEYDYIVKELGISEQDDCIFFKNNTCAAVINEKNEEEVELSIIDDALYIIKAKLWERKEKIGRRNLASFSSF